MSRTKRTKPKIDKAIVIALIGLAGTIITALFASPLLEKLFASAPASETEVVSDTAPALVFKEDFEKGYASGFAFTSEEWQVMKEKGNFVLEASGTRDGNTSIAFGPNDFSDGRIEFRLYFRNFDGFILNFRSDLDVETYTLYLAPQSGEIQLGHGGAANGWNLDTFESGIRPFNFTEEVWYTMKLEATGSRMSVWVDDKKILSTQDSRLQRGEMEFAIQYDGTVLIDDVAVYQSSP